LHDQVIVLAGIDIGAVFADRLGSRLKQFRVHFLQIAHRFFGTMLHDEFDECIAGTRRRGRTKHFDLNARKRRIDLVPSRVGVWNELAVFPNILREREEDRLTADRDARAALRVGQNDPIKSDFDLGDIDTLTGAILGLRGLDPARRVGDVRVAFANASAEQFHPAAGTGAFNDRRLESCGLAELLGNRCREWENGGGANDPDLVAGFR